jgi:septum formation protein
MTIKSNAVHKMGYTCYTCPVPRPLILASQSPRRRELLATAGIPFTVRAREVEEIRSPGEPPEAYARRLARAKAEAAWEDRAEIVLGADTIVVLDQEVLEKPRDAADARAMLRRLAGREHTVVTGICLRHPGGAHVDSSATRVRFAPLTDTEIDAYVASGEPMDKAGAYAIQGLASKFVERVEGCYFNVIGLPLSQVYRYLKSLK